jgi:hypothetical protein
MPSFIVKPIADDDFYVEWSTVVDAPTAFGTRVGLAKLLPGDSGSSERFRRADQYGTSMMDPALPRDRQWFGWHDRAFLLMEWEIPNRRSDGAYEVARENVRALCERYEAGGDPTDLLTFTPHEDGGDA